MKESKQKYTVSLLLFILSLRVYLKTLAPTITWGDSGELITACHTLGIPHPPGFPLYCLLGKLFTFLPFASIAYRINLMSAFFASLTIILIYLILLKIQVNGSPLRADPPLAETGQRVNGPTGKPANRPTEAKQRSRPLSPRFVGTGRPLTSHIPAIVASLTFAFSKTFWSYALVAEVYALKTFFIALLIYFLLVWKEKKNLKFLYLFTFICGLSLGSHLTIVLLIPAFLYFILIIDRRSLLRGKNLLFMCLLFLLGLSLYLYLPIRSLANPPLDWGNPETLKNFVWMITGKQYQYRLFRLPWNQLPQQGKEYLISFKEEFTWLPLILGFLGIGYFFKRSGRLLLFLFLIFFSDAMFNLCQSIIKAPAHFFLSSFLTFSLCIGYGLGEGASYLLRFMKEKGKVWILISLLFIPLVPLTTHYQSVDQSRNYSAYDWARNVLELVEEKGIIISVLSSSFWYPHYVEGLRPDVTLLSISLLAQPFPWYLEQVIRERPGLNIVPSPGVTGNYLKYHSYNYPVDSQRINRLIKEYQGKPEMRFTWLVSAIIVNYIVAHNLEEHSIYLTSPYQGIAPDYYLLPRGPIYQIRKDRPSLTINNPQVRHKTGVNFSDALYFLGYDLSPQSVKPGGLLHLTYYWKLLKRPLENRVRVLLIFTDEKGHFALEQGRPKFYESHLLAYGFPLNYGKAQTIKEDYFCTVPSNLPSGDYCLYLALENLEGGRLLEAKETFLPQREGFVRIGKLKVLKR